MASAPFHVDALRNWVYRSFLQDEGDDATVLGIEVDSHFRLGNYSVSNISYIEFADYPRAVPGQPNGNPEGEFEVATGISDLLTGFWFSKAGAHHGRHHFAPGFATQFPTASSSTLGSGKWSVGPSIDFEYESANAKLFIATIALQLWSVAGDEERKEVSMFMLKPILYYSLAENWDLTYEPYGVSVYWNKKPGQKVYLPLGGGIRHIVPIGPVDMKVGLQLFNNVVRPTTGAVWDLRFLLDFAF